MRVASGANISAASSGPKGKLTYEREIRQQELFRRQEGYTY